MEVKVLDSLARIITAIGDHTVAVGDTCGFGDLRNGFKDFCYDCAVLRVDSVNRGDMCFGDDKNMDRGLGIDVVKSKNAIILVRFFGRDFSCDDLTENTHKSIPSLSFIAL